MDPSRRPLDRPAGPDRSRLLKLYAAADDIGPTSRHFTDLLALRPTQEELDAAVAWIRGTQDPSAAFSGTLDMVVQNVRQRTR